MRETKAETIEAQLREVWKEMSRSGEEMPEAVLRACVLNLIIHSPDESNESNLIQTVADITINHPGRIFLLLPGVNDITASVNALCHFQAGRRKQVCCEQILIRANENHWDLIPGIIEPLLIPDLPAILWWRAQFDPERALFHSFMNASTRVIFDSSTFKGNIASLAEFVKSRRQSNAFSDLSWAQLTPWRVMISGFFDLPPCVPRLKDIERVEIEYAGSNGPPLEAHLLIGWLGSRLKWKNSQEAAEINLKKKAAAAAAGVYSVKIFLGPSDPAILQVSRQDDSLMSFNSLAGCAPAHPTRLLDFNESHLISKELEITGHDRVYEEALLFFTS